MGNSDAYFSSGIEGKRAILLIHGFTGSPHSLFATARYFETNGFKVALPRLPGHGTRIEDLLELSFDDWYSAAVELGESMLERCASVDLFGLSMGGSIVLKMLEELHGFGKAVLVNPLVDPPAPNFTDLLRSILESGFKTSPGISSDIAKPGTPERGYEETPIRAALSLFNALPEIAGRLDAIENEILLFSSRRDHVVPQSSGDLLASSLPPQRLSRIWLERSFHVATLDYDAEFINETSLEFLIR